MNSKFNLKRSCIALSIAQLFVAANALAADDAKSSDAQPASALETIKVEAQRSSEKLARKVQEEAPNLVNVRTTEEMRKLPDVSVAEAIARIPGISLETDTGEGRYINIRGLDSDLNSTTFGGLRLPPSNPASPQGGGRAVALDAIPAGFVGAITVTKTNTPEQDAEALGGTIEITPKTAPKSGRPFLEGHVGTGYEDQRHTGITDLSFSAGGRFGGSSDHNSGVNFKSDNPFSIVVTAAYYEDKRGINDVEPSFLDDGVHSPMAMSGWDQRWYEYNRKSHGVGVDLGYSPDVNNQYYIRAFDAGYTEIKQDQHLSINLDGTPATTATGFVDGLSAGGFDKKLTDEKERIDNKVAMIGGENRFDGNVLDYRLGYTRGSYDQYHNYGSDFNYTPAAGAPVTINGVTVTSPTISYSNAGPGYTPSYTTSVDFLNPANYTLAKFNDNTQNIADSEWSVVSNYKMPVNWGHFDSESFKFGVSSRNRTRTSNDQPYSYTNLPALPLTAASSGPSISYYGGVYQNGPQITVGQLQNQFAANRTITANDQLSAALAYQKDKEDINAFYGQYQFKTGAFSLIAGARVENTHAQYYANSQVQDASGNTSVVPTNAEKHYTDFFPTVQARYELDDHTLVRAAISSTIARPGFNQINPSITVNNAENTVSGGNPDLKPTKANSFDVSIERYLPNAGIASIGFFDKELKDYIVNSVSTQTFPQTGIYSGLTGVAHVYSFVNAPNGSVRGIELNYEQRFKMLPGFWKGLGAGFNYTYVDSKAAIHAGSDSMLPSTSRNTANATVFYEHDGLDMRLAAYYVSHDLWGIQSGAPDVYSDSRFSVDFGSSYAINKKISVYFNAKNLADTPLKFYEGTPDRTIQREFYGRTYQVGMNFNY
ncbi:MAG: TonB-dependent receptor [Burkholderiales bacterium]|nr:TonB-dependent receptor [Burkholderiales bacterium]